MTGGTDDGSRADPFGVGQHIGYGTVVGKVHDHIRLHRPQLSKGPGHAVFSVQTHPARHLLGELSVNQLSHCAVGAAQNRSHRAIPSFRISA